MYFLLVHMGIRRWRSLQKEGGDHCRKIFKKSEQAHISYGPTLLENAAHNECQCQAFKMGNLTENHYQIFVIIEYILSINNCHICSDSF